MLRLFSDGGVLWDGLGVGSRSTIGGTYAFVILEEDDRVACEKSGVIEASVLGYTAGAQLPTVTNQLSELYSIAYGIMHVPEDAEVYVYSDSECALGRMFRQQTLNGVPMWLRELTCNARDRILTKLGRTPWTMVAGHATRAELAAGSSIEKRDRWGKVTRTGGAPVDKWNNYVDHQCKLAGIRWLKERGETE